MRLLLDTNRYGDFCKGIPEAVAAEVEARGKKR